MQLCREIYLYMHQSECDVVFSKCIHNPKTLLIHSHDLASEYLLAHIMKQMLYITTMQVKVPSHDSRDGQLDDLMT